jgi:hypothetical protein
MSNTPTLDWLIELERMSNDSPTAYRAIVAKRELQALIDDIHVKEAQIIELESRITDIHRHYAKRLGD